jgi:5'-deoxynucleotidase YfbR-like HD superfamily hydrolase
MSSLSLLKDRLHMIERSARVRRYHTEPVLHQQNVGEHTYGVMWIVYLLTDGQPSRDLLLAAMMHDAPEFYTGDIPAPTKRLGDIKAVFDAIEDSVMDDLQLEMPTLTDAETRTLKLADCLEGALFCSWEVRRGNLELLDSLRNYIKYIENLHPAGTAADILSIIKERHNAQL